MNNQAVVKVTPVQKLPLDNKLNSLLSYVNEHGKQVQIEPCLIHHTLAETLQEMIKENATSATRAFNKARQAKIKELLNQAIESNDKIKLVREKAEAFDTKFEQIKETQEQLRRELEADTLSIKVEDFKAVDIDYDDWEDEVVVEHKVNYLKTYVINPYTKMEKAAIRQIENAICEQVEDWDYYNRNPFFKTYDGSQRQRIIAVMLANPALELTNLKDLYDYVVDQLDLSEDLNKVFTYTAPAA